VFVGLSAVGYFGAVWTALAVAISVATLRNVAFPVLLTASSVWTADLLLALAIKAMAFSRVYVGVHYPGDVVVGAALGTAVGLAWVAALRRPRRSAEAPRQSGAGPPAG
jgi:undecaprenyl-diphosphatase